ncbi:MAG: flagellar basal body-associated FliL family protein [Steroidobacteraceae bacterium]|jgi:flagellar FliL protein|nr:flagellar basal body-associated FliL family protein [Steroidobacteraceae bacterium]
MQKSRWVTAWVLTGFVALITGGGATWFVMASQTQSRPGKATPVVDTRAYKYISLEKVIVRLRSQQDEETSHYMAMDLVLKTPIDEERVTREHLPLLRSVTVKALSNLTYEEANRATVEELTKLINAAYTETYANDRVGKPFREAMVGKLIIE